MPRFLRQKKKLKSLGKSLKNIRAGIEQLNVLSICMDIFIKFYIAICEKGIVWIYVNEA